MASTYLTRTFGTNSVLNRKFTYSFWIKRSGLGECTVTSAYQSGTYFAGIKFLSDDRFEIYDYRGSYILQKITSRKFRDTNAGTNAAEKYIFMAFAENPFVTSTGIPTTAK